MAFVWRIYTHYLLPEIRRLADAFLMNPKEISVAPPASTWRALV